MFLYLYVLTIFLLSSTPPSLVKSIQIYGLDKMIHFIEYFILGLIFVKTQTFFRSKYHYIIVVIPIIDEFIIQNYSGRHVDLYDFIANIIGLYVGIRFSIYFLEK